MAERASLENWRPRKGSASSNLAPSAIFSRVIGGIGAGTVVEMWLKSVTVPHGCMFFLNDSSWTASFLSPSVRSASQTIA